MEDGTIFDPYFAEDIIPREGQQIRFEYEINTEIITPCSISESPISITCFEEISEPVFEDYVWLNTIVDTTNCNSESIIDYDVGPYHFVSVESTSGRDLYYQNGTFYCSDSPGYSCIEAYGLSDSDIVNSWSCTDKQTQMPGQNNSYKAARNTSINIYPNPTKGKIFIEFHQENEDSNDVTVFDLTGKILYQNRFERIYTTLDLSNLTKGIYLIKVQNKATQNIQKLLIE